MATASISTVQGTKIKKELTGLKSALATAFNQYSVNSLIGKRKKELNTLTKKKVRSFLGSIDAETELAENIYALQKALATHHRTPHAKGTATCVCSSMKDFKLIAGKTLVELKTLATSILSTGTTTNLIRDISVISNTAAYITAFVKNPKNKANLKKLVIQGEVISKKTGSSWSNLKLVYTGVVGNACIVAGVSAGSSTVSSMAAIGTGYALLHTPILAGKTGAGFKKAKANAVAGKMLSLMKRIKIVLAFNTAAKSTKRYSSVKPKNLFSGEQNEQGESLIQRFTFSGR